MSVARAGSLLREIMDPVPTRLAAVGPTVTAEQAGHYCIPVKLKRLYRQRKLGTPFAREEGEATKKGEGKLPIGAPPAKPMFGRIGDDWDKGEPGLV
ncbi:unnamed protein product [Sphacelaria rigidula]